MLDFPANSAADSIDLPNYDPCQDLQFQPASAPDDAPTNKSGLNT